MRYVKVISLLLTTILSIQVSAQNKEPSEILLWSNGAPGSNGKAAAEQVKLSGNGERIITSVHRPSITPYLPTADKATGAAIIIAPGGGHFQLSIDHEGYAVARWLSEHGIAAFVLKYRLAREPNSTYTIDGEAIADLQRSIRMIRSRSKEWSIDTARIGVMGFSAGGELAALSAMRYDQGLTTSVDVIATKSSKPAFQVLIYPGNAKRYEVTKTTPPAFIACGYNDRPDIARGMADLYLKYKDAGVPAELHIYAGSGHGFGLRQTDKKPHQSWPERLYEWMDDMGFLKSVSKL